MSTRTALGTSHPPKGCKLGTAWAVKSASGQWLIDSMSPASPYRNERRLWNSYGIAKGIAKLWSGRVVKITFRAAS